MYDTNGAYLDEPSWSPDGNGLVFIVSRHTDTPDPEEGVYASGADGYNARRVFARTETFGHIHTPRYTGDGRIIFEYDDVVGGPTGILSIPASCQDCTLGDATFLGSGHHPAWTAATIWGATPADGKTPPVKANFVKSKSVIKVGRNRVFRFSFTATPGLTGNAVFRSLKKVRISKKRRVTFAKKSFTVPASGKVTLKAKLSKKNFRILRLNRKVRASAAVTLKNAAGLTSNAAKTVTFKAPQKGR